MRREGKLPEEDVRRILAEVADALHYAHKQGVVHRDIKPDNVLLDDESGRPMLTDFGVAKAKASGTTLTEAGAVVGTPYYMSPEQASGVKEIDGRSDLYSLGVMGYQMLAGRLPFEGESFQDVIAQHVTQEPAPLSALAADAPPDLAQTVMRCLEKEPGKRWPDGLQLRTALSALDGEGELTGIEAQIEATGFAAAAWVWLSALVGLVCYLDPDAHLVFGPWWTVPVGLASVLPLAGADWGRKARALGLSWSTIRKRVLAPPRWWQFWWPRRWRRPGDVWDRLPIALRWPRNLIGAALAYGAVGFAPLLMVFLYRLSAISEGDFLTALGVALGCLATVVGATMYPVFWARARGFDDVDGNRIFFAPTSRLSLWRQPRIAALLLPPPGRAPSSHGSEPRSPEEYAQAIRDLVGQLPSGTQATVSEAADAARQLLGTLAALDAEIAKLAQDADPQELEAIETKLRALGPESSDEGEMRREKRALLAHQRDLLRRLDQRLAGLRERRSRLADLLRTMWLQVANLRAEAAHDTLAVTEISGRIRALCTEIDAHVQAAGTVRVEGRGI